MDGWRHPIQIRRAAAAVGDNQPFSGLPRPKDRPTLAQTRIDTGYRASLAAAHCLFSVMLHFDNRKSQIGQQSADRRLDPVIVAHWTRIVDADLPSLGAGTLLPLSARVQELVDRLHGKPIPVLTKHFGAVRAGGQHSADAVAGQNFGQFAECGVEMGRSP